MPVLITKSAYFNFLREYWLACTEEGKSSKALITEASFTWQELEPNERALYEEVCVCVRVASNLYLYSSPYSLILQSTYIGARLAHDLYNDQEKSTARKRKSATKVNARTPKTPSARRRPTSHSIRTRSKAKRRGK